MELTATCQRCGRSFGSGIAIENSYNVSIQGITSQCPYCGGVGGVQEGTYSVDDRRVVIEKAFKTLNESTITVSDLRNIEMILRQARARGATVEQAVEEVGKVVPQANGLTSLLNLFQSNENGTRTDKLALLIALLAFLLQVMTTYGQMPEQLTDDTIHRIVMQAQKEMRHQPLSPLSPLPMPDEDSTPKSEAE